jgi:hypothetical protein
MPDCTVATCFSDVAFTVRVDPVSGLFVTASIARTAFVAVARERAVCVTTSTLVTPASTATLGNAGHA